MCQCHCHAFTKLIKYYCILLLMRRVQLHFTLWSSLYIGKKVMIKSLVDNINQSYNLQSYYLCIYSCFILHDYQLLLFSQQH